LANAENVGHTIEVSNANVFVPSAIGSHEFISEAEFIAGETVLGKAEVQILVLVREPENEALPSKK